MAKRLESKRKHRKPKSSGDQKKQAFHTGNSSTNPDRVLPPSKKEGFYRSKSTINRLNMYRTKPDLVKRRIEPSKPVRIHPDRRWFGNTRVVTQGKLDAFREEMSKEAKNPYSVLIRRSKLPMSLLKDAPNVAKMDLLSVEPFTDTFGVKQRRKRPKLSVCTVEEMMDRVIEKGGGDVDEGGPAPSPDEGEDPRAAPQDHVFRKGTSRRIWQELYKVIDSSDIVVQVIDARDPMGTRCLHLEKKLRKEKGHKHLVLLLNKCDLVPSWATARWVKLLSKEFPTLAFHASITNPFGKSALINLLRQFANLLKGRQHVSVGFIGYPNVGKSSVINSLKKRKCAGPRLLQVKRKCGST